MNNSALEWQDRFSVDITSIDDQHKELIRLSQELVHVLAMDSIPVSKKQSAIKALVDFALDHFAHEEKIMRHIHYPNLEEHIAEHDELRREIRTIYEDVLTGDGVDNWPGLLGMMQVWVFRHMISTDAGIRDYLHNDPEPEAETE